MNTLVKLLFVGVALLAAAPLAQADQIQFTGNVSFNESNGAVTFDNAQSKVNQAGTGSLLPFTLASTVTFSNFTYNASPAGAGTLLLTVLAPSSSSTLKFYMTQEDFSSATAKNPAFTNYEFSGSGYYVLTTSSGVSMPSGMFDLTSQGVTGGSTANLSFSDFNVTSAATPEPSSLLLLGTGLIGAAGSMLRQRRLVVA